MKKVLACLLLGLVLMSVTACDVSQKCPQGVCDKENSPKPAEK